MKKIFKIILFILCFNTCVVYNSNANILIEKAKKTQDSQDQYIVGKAYFEGTNGFSQDYYQAFRWLDKASEEKHIEAINLLAQMYEKGLGVKKDFAKAIILYKKTSDLGSVIGMSRIGVYYYNKATYPDALRLLKKAHKKGVAEASSYLGMMYLQGKGVEKNAKKGIKLILRAANKGDVNGQYLMGSLFFERKFGMVNYNKAQEWFTKAGKQGNEKAQFNLAQIYYYGKGCKIDYPKAFRWYQKSAEQGNKLSQYRLALMYVKGKGVKQDDDQAYYWCKKSMDQGYEKAKPLLEAIEMKRKY